MANRKQVQSRPTGQDARRGRARPTAGRGFAGMDPDTQREIASEGGKAAHASGHAHEFTSEEAREAGRKGGEVRGSRSQASRSAAARRSGDKPAGNGDGTDAGSGRGNRGASRERH